MAPSSYSNTHDSTTATISDSNDFDVSIVYASKPTSIDYIIPVEVESAYNNWAKENARKYHNTKYSVSIKSNMRYINPAIIMKVMPIKRKRVYVFKSKIL